MKAYFLAFGLTLLFVQCKSPIKDENASVITEPGADTNAPEIISTSGTTEVADQGTSVFWVGYFLNADDDDNAFKKDVHAGEAFTWTRENKINISIDRIEGEKVTGHSVVAGNNRPFTGTVKTGNGISKFEVKEPGDNKYDGAFSFTINDTLLEGTWKSFKKIEIPNRKYKLKKRTFVYNPDIMLSKNSRFIDWEKKLKVKHAGTEGDDYEDANFSSATDLIFKVNASNKLLTEKEVENLKKGDLLIIRNTIYARHGYSFKNRPLRVFFDAQDWYIPVFADIKSDFTAIEKQNIELLLRYEKNAKEYYDYFGRG